MNTPICDFVSEYNKSCATRLHMPGHKGNAILGNEPLDITEIEGADVLYSPNGIILESQQNASKLFDCARTVYSVEGSSLCIRAMVCLTAIYANKLGNKPIIATFRNVHKAFVSAVSLVGVEVEWLYPKISDGLISCKISAEELEKQLDEMLEKPTAVYLTSPDYLGNIADIKGISKVCKARNILLLVDNAHGAYLNFLKDNIHPIHLGADICCDSAHKTLPVLTGGAYLHISKTAPSMFCQFADEGMSLFASTSPSYLILQSLDRANYYLFNGYKEKLNAFIKKIDLVRQKLINHGYKIIGDEPLKMTLAPKSFGYTGIEISQILQSKNIFCEFADKDYLVMMFTVETPYDQIENVANILLKINKRKAIEELPPPITRRQNVLSMRQASLMLHRQVKVADSLGKILGATSISCPPAVPILVSGEKIDKNAIDCFNYYEINSVSIIDD